MSGSHLAEDGHLGELSASHRERLSAVLDLSRGMLEAAERGLDLTGVTRHLDPDPSRYFFVDEGAGRIPEFLTEGRRLLEDAPHLVGHTRHPVDRLDGRGDASRPAVASADDGRILVAWVAWQPAVGERVMAMLMDRHHRPLVAAEAISGAPADCFRPRVLFDRAARPWVFYARSEAGVSTEVAVHARRFEGGRWRPEERVSATQHPSFNQEAVAHADGSVECVWQARDAGRFAVYARRWRQGGWGPTEQIDDREGGSIWDPCVALLPDGGTVYAWCAYADGAYRLLVRVRRGESTGEVRRITTGTDYALHPSLVGAEDGSVWCAFDRMTIHGHGGSGPTALHPAERLTNPRASQMKGPGEFVPPELSPNIGGRVQVVRITEEGVEVDAIPLGQGLEVNPAGMPQIAATAGGGVSIAYRVIRRLPLSHYFWEVAVQQIGPDGVGPVATLSSSDGGMEEPSVAWAPQGAVVVATTDGRKQHALEWTDGFGGQRRADLVDHVGEIAWNGLHGVGELVLASLPPVGRARRGRPAPASVSNRREEARAWKGEPQDRYETEVDGRQMALYWGDLHRHSLISRCTAGDDPGLEDFYRFAWDVHDYDFWAVTDHAENSTAHQWWHIQKVADLFHVPGRFVPLYGFEWTSGHGHQNVIYGDVARGAPIFSAMDELTDDPGKLWAAMRRYPGFPAITIPHHPGAAMVHYDWDFGDPDYLRVVEVFQSCRGNYEFDGAFRQYEDATLSGTFTLDGLRRGHRFGLIASSDHGYGASYVGTYAEDLNRGSVFAALHARRTVAATARGIVLDVRVGDTFLGGERTQDGPVELSIHVRGYRDLARIEVVRSGELAHLVSPDLTLPAGWIEVPIRVEWGRSGRPRRWDGTLTVHGGEVVSTPFHGPEVREVGRSTVRWEAETTSFGGGGLYGPTRGGVEVTVVGPPHAKVEVRTVSGAVTARLAEVRTGPVDASRADGPVGSVLRLIPGTGGLTSLGQRAHSMTVVDPHGAPAWYYVRAYLVDGEMAWSSPIWVDPVPTT